MSGNECTCSEMIMPRGSFFAVDGVVCADPVGVCGASATGGGNATIAGLYAGNAKRETARPTAERLLEAFQGITLTVIKLPEQTICHVTPLSPVQLRVLEILGFSVEVYTNLEAISVKPP